MSFSERCASWRDSKAQIFTEIRGDARPRMEIPWKLFIFAGEIPQEHSKNFRIAATDAYRGTSLEFWPILEDVSRRCHEWPRKTSMTLLLIRQPVLEVGNRRLPQIKTASAELAALKLTRLMKGKPESIWAYHIAG